MKAPMRYRVLAFSLALIGCAAFVRAQQPLRLISYREVGTCAGVCIILDWVPAHFPVDCEPSVSRSKSTTSTSRLAS